MNFYFAVILNIMVAILTIIEDCLYKYLFGFFPFSSEIIINKGSHSRKQNLVQGMFSAKPGHFVQEMF